MDGVTDGLEGDKPKPRMCQLLVTRNRLKINTANAFLDGFNMHHKFDAFEWRSVPGTCLGEGGK